MPLPALFAAILSGALLLPSLRCSGPGEGALSKTQTQCNKSSHQEPPALIKRCSILYEVDGDVAGERFGTSLDTIGDVDGDLVPDFAVGSPSRKVESLAESGRVSVFSGAHGQKLYEFSDPGGATGFSESLAHAGDVNGDGVADIIVGNRAAALDGIPYVGKISVHSGVDGSLLLETNGQPLFSSAFGVSVSSAGDIDGDRADDVLVGAIWEDRDGAVHLLSGSDGSHVYRVTGGVPEGGFGYSVSTVGDIDTDGTWDFIVGSNGEDFASLFSGRKALLIERLTRARVAGERFGFSVSGGGDVSGDGIPDFAVGAVWANSEVGEQVGRVDVFSGADRTLLMSLGGEGSRAHFGGEISIIPDADCDGHADVLVGASGHLDTGAAYLFSGRDGSPLCRIEGERPLNIILGGAVAPAGDINRDGREDFLVGDGFASPDGKRHAGKVWVLAHTE